MKWISLSLLLFLFACATQSTIEKSVPWPSKITNLNEGLVVRHSHDTVYATLNTKDPGTHGKYQLKFKTSVSSKKEAITITEFGGYFLNKGAWEFRSIFNRPFNVDEFKKWYSNSDGIVRKGEWYADADNWLTKTNNLTGDTLTVLLYFIGTNDQNEKVMGAREIVGVVALEE